MYVPNILSYFLKSVHIIFEHIRTKFLTVLVFYSRFFCRISSLNQIIHKCIPYQIFVICWMTNNGSNQSNTKSRFSNAYSSTWVKPFHQQDWRSEVKKKKTAASVWSPLVPKKPEFQRELRLKLWEVAPTGFRRIKSWKSVDLWFQPT